MDFLIYDLKIALLFALFWGGYRLLLRGETFHRLNRSLLLLSAVIALLLPLCVLPLPAAFGFAPPVVAVVLPAVGDGAFGGAPLVAAAATPWWHYALGLTFVGGALATALRAGLAWVRAWRLVRSGERSRTINGVRLVLIDAPIAPFSWMNAVVLSRRDAATMAHGVLLHECAHVRFRHSYDVLLADVLSVVQWFNPFFWGWRADLRAVHEFEADASVLHHGVSAKPYQYLLLQLGTGHPAPLVANAFNLGLLKTRIAMMQREASPLRRCVRWLYVVPIAAFSLVATGERAPERLLPAAANGVAPSALLVEAVDTAYAAPASPAAGGRKRKAARTFLVSGRVERMTYAYEGDQPPTYYVDSVQVSKACLDGTTNVAYLVVNDNGKIYAFTRLSTQPPSSPKKNMTRRTVIGKRTPAGGSARK